MKKVSGMIRLLNYLKRHWKAIGFALGFICLGMIFSLATAEGVHATSDAKFCGSCHVMEPMVAAYREDVHGGNSHHGVTATCVDCHLPHDSVFGYLMAKTASGIKDVWGNVVLDPSKIDWEERRSHREHFVYDSGCLNCHKNLDEATKSNMKAFLPHRDYFMGVTNVTCVACHENVGHKNLGLHLKKEK